MYSKEGTKESRPAKFPKEFKKIVVPTFIAAAGIFLEVSEGVKVKKNIWSHVHCRGQYFLEVSEGD